MGQISLRKMASGHEMERDYRAHHQLAGRITYKVVDETGTEPGPKVERCDDKRCA